MAHDEIEATVPGRGTIDRRTLIKRAATAGGLAYTAPVVLASLPSPAAAQSAAAGCYKYMFDWRWAPNVHACPDGLGSPQQDATACTQNLGESHEKIPVDGVSQKYPNPNCCEDKEPAGPGGSGNVLQWYQLPDIPGGCVTVTSNQPCATSTTDVQVTFTIACPGCRITDGMVGYDSSGELVNGNPNYCAVASASTTGFASSKLVNSVSITFTGTKVPVWFKFYVACGLDPDHPQNDGYFPDTDCQFFDSDSTII